MGQVFAEIELSNPRRSDLPPIRVQALADTGALMFCAFRSMLRSNANLKLSLRVRCRLPMAGR